MNKHYSRYPMSQIAYQDPKTLKIEGVAVGMYALPKSMALVQVSSGYGLFLIIHERKGYYHLAFDDAVLEIKKKDCDVYA